MFMGANPCHNVDECNKKFPKVDVQVGQKLIERAQLPLKEVWPVSLGFNTLI